ncbi:hypothetical protein [Bacteroides heparinolyticus]|uniref:hypothetical protein n=1 Tax=Prevotella heparinolytica TaxID=28113 RepID=UPI00359F34F6
MNILLLIGGLLLILLGANGLTDGAASVAKRFLSSTNRPPAGSVLMTALKTFSLG